MPNDVALGKLLEAVHQSGGFCESLPPIAGVTNEQVVDAAERAEQLGYISVPAGRNAAGHLIAIYNVRLNRAGTEFLVRYRVLASHADEKARLVPALDSSIEGKTSRRAEFMSAVYEKSKGSEAVVINGPELGDQFGWPRGETDDVMRYWHGERLIRYVAEEGLIEITHQGIVEIEQAAANPARPTTHFRPNTIIFHGDVIGSQIQAGTTDSSQAITSGIDVMQLTEFLIAMKAAMSVEPLPNPDENSEAQSLIALVETQLARAEPRTGLVKSAVTVLRDFSIGMAASGAWAGVVPLAHQLLH